MGLIWEISSICRAFFRHFPARAFFVEIPRSQHSIIYTIFSFFRIHIPKIDFSTKCFSHPTRPPARPPARRSGHPKYKSRHPKYKSRHPKYEFKTLTIISDTQNTSPKPKIQVQTLKIQAQTPPNHMFQRKIESNESITISNQSICDIYVTQASHV